MRLLLVDHGSSDPPHGRVHGIRAGLEQLGIATAVCGPSRVPGLEAQPPGMFGIHLRDVAAASRGFLAAVQAGTPEAFLAATAAVPARLLGLARETARQAIAEAVEIVYPDVIFVLHAGILTDLAIETGAPVVVHVSAADLAATHRRPSLRNLVAAAIGSSAVIVAADEAVAATLATEWLADAPDAAPRLETWPLGPDVATRVAIACRRARRRA
jgi:hypothetical protein